MQHFFHVDLCSYINQADQILLNSSTTNFELMKNILKTIFKNSYSILNLYVNLYPINAINEHVWPIFIGVSLSVSRHVCSIKAKLFQTGLFYFDQ